jgi:hypothetical protein
MCDRMDALNRADPWLQRARSSNPESITPPVAQRNVAPDQATEPTEPPSPEPVVSIVWFRPEDLYQGDDFYTFVSGGLRTPLSGTWAGLARAMSRSSEGDPWLRLDLAKRARGAWVSGRYRGTHGRKDLPQEFIGTRLLVADVDSGDPREVADALAPYRAIVHSTYKHRPDAPRCRAIILLADECTSAKHYNQAEHAVADYLNGKGFRCPAGDSTLGKLAFLPMHQRGISPVFLTTNGQPFDIARVVRADEERRRLAPPPRTCTGTSQDHAGAIRWAEAKVAAASQGERHNTRRDKARWLSELGVDANTIRRVCLEAASDAKAVAAVEWAIVKGREAQP